MLPLLCPSPLKRAQDGWFDCHQIAVFEYGALSGRVAAAAFLQAAMTFVVFANFAADWPVHLVRSHASLCDLSNQVTALLARQYHVDLVTRPFFRGVRSPLGRLRRQLRLGMPGALGEPGPLNCST